MNNSNTLKEKIMNIVYVAVLPIYLWSIGFKSLNDYVDALNDEHCHLEGHLPNSK